MIAKCPCAHKFQDKTHGRGKRVHNKTTKGARCTACGVEKVGNATTGKKK